MPLQGGGGGGFAAVPDCCADAPAIAIAAIAKADPETRSTLIIPCPIVRAGLSVINETQYFTGC